MLTQWLKNCLCEFHHIFNFSAGDRGTDCFED